MRFIVLFVFSMMASAASAGTLVLQFVEQSSRCWNLDPEYVGCHSPGFSTPMSFIFDVSLDGPLFQYETTNSGPINPYGAVMTSRPDGTLGNYFGTDHQIQISLTDTSVSVLGRMYEGDDLLLFRSESVKEDHNQGLHNYEAFGYWSADYQPSSAQDGTAFPVNATDSATVPLPATFPLLAAALGFFGVRRLRAKVG